MVTKTKRKVLITVVIFLFILVTVSLSPLLNSLSTRLSITKRVKANILLVEGWLPPYAIEMAYKEFKNNGYSEIITTGLNSPDYYMVYTNGFLKFYPGKNLSAGNEFQDHIIEVDAYSQLSGENSSKFNFFINDSLIAGFTAEKRKRKFSINWYGKLTGIDSVMIQFINDEVGSFGDRNLFVKEIIIDKEIEVPYKNNSVFEISNLNGEKRIINNFTSYAQLARTRLMFLGIDSSLITAIPGKRVKTNRTLTSALAFRDWLSNSSTEVNGINIITTGTHARRTWMTYNRILNANYKIGVISLQDNNERYSRKYKVYKTLRESVALIYYWVILIPY
jgi:hypothetical protein